MIKQSYTFKTPIGVLTMSEADQYLTGVSFERDQSFLLAEQPGQRYRKHSDVLYEAVRAVGQANNRNPILIIVPCHRVIHKNGDIAGFACGDDVKRYLLELEGRAGR